MLARRDIAFWITLDLNAMVLRVVLGLILTDPVCSSPIRTTSLGGNKLPCIKNQTSTTTYDGWPELEMENGVGGDEGDPPHSTRWLVLPLRPSVPYPLCPLTP